MPTLRFGKVWQVIRHFGVLHAGLSGAPEGRNLLCSPNAEHKALRSSNFQLITFFFALLAGYYRTLLYRDTRPLLPSPPPPYAAAAARRRRRRTPPPSSPLPHPPPPPLPQHATAVTPESFADVVRVCCTPRRLRCRPFAYRATVHSLVLHQQRGGATAAVPWKEEGEVPPAWLDRGRLRDGKT